MSEHDGSFRMGTARVLGGTAKALRVEVEGEKMWIPKSVIHDDSEVYSEVDGRGEREGMLVVKLWWAEKEGHA